jgi:hypothetical protein
LEKAEKMAERYPGQESDSIRKKARQEYNTASYILHDSLDKWRKIINERDR